MDCRQRKAETLLSTYDLLGEPMSTVIIGVKKYS